jgi:hypothetical protein
MFGYVTAQHLGVPNSDITSSTSNPYQLYSASQGFIVDAELASPCVLAAEWPPVELFSLVQIASLCDR